MNRVYDEGFIERMISLRVRHISFRTSDRATFRLLKQGYPYVERIVYDGLIGEGSDLRFADLCDLNPKEVVFYSIGMSSSEIQRKRLTDEKLKWQVLFGIASTIK